MEQAIAVELGRQAADRDLHILDRRHAQRAGAGRAVELLREETL